MKQFVAPLMAGNQFCRDANPVAAGALTPSELSAAPMTAPEQRDTG
jgi:hypothetical protein